MDRMSRSGYDDAFRALAALERRRLLVSLLEKNPQQGVRVPDDIHDDERDLELLGAEMFHSHLPMLEERGFIRWDREENEVEKGPRFDEIRPLLELIQSRRHELPEGWV